MSNSTLNAYAEQFKVWPSKFVGAKPTAEQLETYNKLGARHGLQCLAGAMALRENGVTGAEIVMACGNPQLNKMRGFITDALVKRVPMPKRNGHEVYKLVVTPKCLTRIKASEAKAAKLEAEGNKAVVDKKATAITGKPGKASKRGKRLAKAAIAAENAAASDTLAGFTALPAPGEPVTDQTTA